MPGPGNTIDVQVAPLDLELKMCGEGMLDYLRLALDCPVVVAFVIFSEFPKSLSSVK